jgi:hypothetical protein
MPNHDAAKAAKELEVFKLFARLTQLRVQWDTVEQKLDSPDISCRFENGEAATYELVTLDSEESSQTWGDFHSMSGAWARSIQSLPEDRRQLFFELYRHAAITPVYSARPNRKERGTRIALIVDKLLEQPAGFVGLVTCDKDRIKVEKKLNSSAVDSFGPIMLDSMSPTPRTVAWARIRDKVEKRYKVAGRFELIAYSYRDTLFHQSPEDAIPPADDIRAWLRDSAFSRLWILEWHYKQIDHAPGRGVRVVSSGSVGLVLSGPQRTAERVDCRSEFASLQAACIDAAAPIRHFAQATALRPVA